MLHLFDIALQLNGFPIKKAKTYFEKLQEIPEQDFENYVIQKKEEIVNYHINNNPSYQEFMGKSEFENWNDLPIMTKKDFQKPLLDRLSKEKIAIIQATGFGKVESEDANTNAIPDVLEMSRLANDQSKAAKDYETKMADLQSKNKQANDKMSIEKEKIAVQRENMANDLAVAKENAKGRNNKKG